jgi:hypothetical protein
MNAGEHVSPLGEACVGRGAYVRVLKRKHHPSTLREATEVSPGGLRPSSPHRCGWRPSAWRAASSGLLLFHAARGRRVARGFEIVPAPSTIGGDIPGKCAKSPERPRARKGANTRYCRGKRLRSDSLGLLAMQKVKSSTRRSHRLGCASRRAGILSEPSLRSARAARRRDVLSGRGDRLDRACGSSSVGRRASASGRGERRMVAAWRRRWSKRGYGAGARRSAPGRARPGSEGRASWG